MTTLLLSVAALTAAAPQAFQGRGVHYAEAAIGCPLRVAIGDRSGRACLRIALYDGMSTVEVDRAKRRILIRNAHAYPETTLIADVLLPGWSEVPDGRSPAAAHLLVRKTGNRFSGKFHAHAMSREKPKSVEMEDFEVTATDGSSQTPLMTVEAARKAVLDPGLAAKLAGELVEVKDNLGKSDPKGEAAPAGDITVALGIGAAAVPVLRAQLFRHDVDYQLRLTALSDLIPKAVLRRELFLYGVGDLAALAGVEKHGLKSGETVVFTVHGEKGTVAAGKASAELADAAGSLRGFLEGNFIGALLAHQAHLDAAP